MKKHTIHVSIGLLVLILSLTVASTIYPILKPQNTLEIPKTSAGEINILTPENITYTEPMSGYYPATYGFENDQVGTIPEGWTDESPYSSCSISVYDQKDQHKQVVQIYDANTGTGADATAKYNFESPKVTGIIECWVYKESGDCALIIQGNNDTTSGFQISIDAENNGVFRYNSAPSTYVEFATGKYSDQKWFHLRIDFDCNTDTTDIYVNGIKEVDDGSFILPVPNLSFIQIRSGHSGRSGILYFDAVGLSWDASYNIGESFNEGLLLSYENTTNLDWKGFSLDGQANKTIFGNTTIPMPSDGLHIIQVFGNNSIGTMYQSTIRYFSISPINLITPENKTYTQPMGGYNPGTYGFENEEDGNLGTEVEFITRYDSDHSEAYAKIEDNIYGRNGVLKFYDAATSNNYNFYAYHDFPTKIPYGTIEFWVLNTVYSGDPLGIYYHFSNSSGAEYVSVDTFNSLFYLIIDGDNNGLVKIQTGNGERSWSDLYSDYTWHHVRIDFESTVGDYLGLEQYKLNFWFDGLQLLTNEPLIINDSLGVIASHSHGWDDTRHDYLDAIGFSWDPNYNIGDNRYEGLLLSYENSTMIDWIGYSLDGQSNKTILGNTTIPMLNNGLHSIILTVNDTVGTYYTSELIIFTILTSGPIISAITPLFNQYYGISAPSFSTDVQGANLDKFWYSLDNGITNISFYSYSGDISQSEWDKYTHEPVQINFYVNDSFNRIGYAIVTVNKDLNAPTTTISFVPYSGIYVVLITTQFSLSATDNSESGVSTTRYKIDDSAWIPYTGAFTLSGYDSGFYSITYQSIDAVGNIETEKSVVIELYIPPTVPEPPNLFPILVISIGIGLVALIGITIFLLIRKRTPKTPIKARTDEITLSGSDQFKVCPFCYTQIKINAKYCTLCGASLEKD